jgi:enediyne biosynthesis protein E4
MILSLDNCNLDRRPERAAARGCALTLAAVLCALGTPSSAAQTFTRIVDPANPVVNDAFESGGGSWIDLEDDGLLDLFVANGNLTDQDDNLYQNVGGTDFVSVESSPVVTSGGSSIGGTWGDYDSDGVADLFVTNRNNFGNFLFHGDGDTLFTRITTGEPVTDIGNSNSSSWTDVDRDGDLDLYVVNFGAADFLYVNSGAPAYALEGVDTASCQLGNAPTIPGAWADYDNDRDQDLFIGIAGSGNDALYRNDGGLRFTAIGFADARATLGASWGDYDNDGDLDLVTTSFVNQTSLLYQNSGAPAYTLAAVAGSAISAVPGNAVGSGWGDCDNDGDLDLFIARDGQDNLLFENDGPPGYTFTRVLTGSIVNDGGNSFGCAWGDYDNDGGLDLFVANRLNQMNFLYHNDGNANHWLSVRCRGSISNRPAIGARVTVVATIGGTARSQMQEVVSQSGYNSQNLDLHFGLGDAVVADSIVVAWPSGANDTLLGVPADALVRITELSATGVGDGGMDRGDERPLELRQDGIGEGLAIELTLDAAAEVQVALFDVSGRRVGDDRRVWRAMGRHRISLLDGGVPPSGVYVCRVSAGVHQGSLKLWQVR